MMEGIEVTGKEVLEKEIQGIVTYVMVGDKLRQVEENKQKEGRGTEIMEGTEDEDEHLLNQF